MTIKLNSKNEEIFSNIPREYRNIIINTILTRSFENGSALKELNFYLSSEEVDKILEKLELPDIIIKKDKKYFYKNKAKQNISKEIKKKKNEEDNIENLFIGFDKD